MIENEAQFEARRRGRWSRLQALLDLAPSPVTPLSSPQEEAELGVLYRELCADLSRARTQRYSVELVDALERLCSRAHTLVHAASTERRPLPLKHFVLGVAPALRREWRFVGTASVLFGVPFVALMVLAMVSPDLAGLFVDAAAIRDMSASYNEAIRRTADENAQMTGFYVLNNVGIAFRALIGGLLLGAGSVYTLVFNGAVLGATLGWIVADGNGLRLFEFVVSHTAPELVGIVIAGAAGLRLGWCVVRPGDLTRAESLRQGAPVIVQLGLGAGLMIAFAALLEGWVSASGLPLIVKAMIGFGVALSMAGWFAWGGRR